MSKREQEWQAQAEGDESVDSLLRAVARVSPRPLPASSTLELEPAHYGPAEDTEEEPPPALPRVGDVVDGRYAIDEVLGSGGMGVVFAARNLRTGKEVALKYLRVHHGNHRQRTERASRFVREARAAGRIRHPNVVDVYDVCGDKAPYLVMERLYGESLWQRMKPGASEEKLGQDELLSIMLAAMHGVAEAHKQGVVHRDLKPDNIFLARENHAGPPVAKVLDFGVSRLEQREGDETHTTTITRSGYVIGTPAYMPLEQLRGEMQVDARADIYALGVVLYEGLSGLRPYQAKTDQDLLIKLATEDPVPLRVHVPEIDPQLESIVLKALARQPEKRYPDVLSFVRAIEDFRARPPQPPVRPRGRWPMLLFSGLGLAVLVVLWWVLGSNAPSAQTRGAQPVAAKAAPSSAAPAQGASSFRSHAEPRASTRVPPADANGDSAPAVEPGMAPAPLPSGARPQQRKPAAPKALDRATTVLPSDF